MNDNNIVNCPCCDNQMMVDVDYQSEPMISFFCVNIKCDINKHSNFSDPLTYLNKECISYCLPFRRNNKIIYFEGLEYDDITRIYYYDLYCTGNKILISVPFIPIKIENQNTNAREIFDRLLKLVAFA